jgi:hypothetical protein
VQGLSLRPRQASVYKASCRVKSDVDKEVRSRFVLRHEKALTTTVSGIIVNDPAV